MKGISILFVAGLLSMQMLALSPPAAAALDYSPPEGRALTSDILTITTLGFTSTLYPGDACSFYIRAVNQYTGDLYNGPSARPYNGTYLYGTQVTIDEVVNENRQPVIPLPVDWNLSTLQNNNGLGFDLSQGSGVYIYADDKSGRDKFTVKLIDVLPGKYFIRFKETARVMTGYDGTRYTFSTCTDYDYITFEVRSYVGPCTNFKYTLTGLTENDGTETLFAGAVNEKVGFQGLSAVSGTVTDINGTLTVQDDQISVRASTVYSARTGGTLGWRIDIDRETPAGYYNVGLKLVYKRNDVLVVERSTVQTILVQYTPLLTFPDHQNMNTPAVKLVQNTPRDDFSVYVQNRGNVDLMNVVVRMDLDNAAYFQGGELYWNEDQNARLSATDAIAMLGEIRVGSGKQAFFSDLTLKNNLPPGKYLIPMDYSASYRSDGSIRPTGDVIAGGWDEKGYGEYNTIMRAISDPEPLSVSGPSICVQVLDDAQGIELEGQLSGTYYAGSAGNYLTITVTNRERYSFSDVRYTVRTDGSSPLKNPGAPESDPLGALPAVTRSSLPASGQDSIRVFADFKSGAGAGVRHIPVDFQGYNAFNALVCTTLDIPVVLGAHQPAIQSLRTSADLTSGRSGVVTLTVKNYGQGGAWNLSAFFKPAGTAIRSMDDTIWIGNLAPDATATFKFGVAPSGPESTLIGTHSGHIYYKYIDDSGSPKPLFGGGSEHLSFEFRTSFPELVVVLVDCEPVRANQVFTAHVMVKNIGGTAAENTSVLLINPHPVFNVRSKSEISGGLIPAGETQTLNFDFKAGPDITDGTDYRFTLCFSYRRPDGTTVKYSDGEKDHFAVRTKDVVNTSRQEQVVEYKGAGVQVDIGAVLLGVFFLAGIVLLARSLRRPPGPASAPEREVRTPTLPPAGEPPRPPYEQQPPSPPEYPPVPPPDNPQPPA
ncbi:MAG: hypothetical protein FJ149_05280 [Euryarchaeota archaeon]|nr:hypothetical protein [Euryarchaeota archaeon]